MRFWYISVSVCFSPENYKCGYPDRSGGESASCVEQEKTTKLLFQASGHLSLNGTSKEKYFGCQPNFA